MKTRYSYVVLEFKDIPLMRHFRSYGAWWWKNGPTSGYCTDVSMSLRFDPDAPVGVKLKY